MCKLSRLRSRGLFWERSDSAVSAWRVWRSGTSSAGWQQRNGGVASNLSPLLLLFHPYAAAAGRGGSHAVNLWLLGDIDRRREATSGGSGCDCSQGAAGSGRSLIG